LQQRHEDGKQRLLKPGIPRLDGTRAREVRNGFTQAILEGDREAQVVMRDMRAGLKAGGGAVAALRVGVAPGEGASAPLFEKPVELYGA
jgi:hypothetical protein